MPEKKEKRRSCLPASVSRRCLWAAGRRSAHHFPFKSLALTVIDEDSFSQRPSQVFIWRDASVKNNGEGEEERRRLKRRRRLEERRRLLKRRRLKRRRLKRRRLKKRLDWSSLCVLVLVCVPVHTLTLLFARLQQFLLPSV